MDDLREIAEFKSYQPGEFIVKSGESRRNLYLLSSGELEVINTIGFKDLVIARMCAPETFGEDSFLSGLPCPVSIVAKTAVDVWVINHQKLVDHGGQIPSWFELMVKTLSKRERDFCQPGDLQLKVNEQKMDERIETEDASVLPKGEEIVPQTAPLSEKSSSDSLDILVVDDFESNVMIARKVLEKKGHEVEVAYDGLSALKKLSISKFDFILLDVKMPEMDGTDTTAFIRQCEAGTYKPSGIHQEILSKLQSKIRGGRVPIIAMTAHDGSGEKEKCLASGMDDYITKPFHVKSVMEAYDRVMASRKQGNK